MGTWKSRGLRGSQLEELINRTNEAYLEKKLAVVQKIPTPITPINMNEDHTQITLAYFDQKSTVDYIGLVQGIPVCFDAKECATNFWPLQNLHPHQVRFMQAFEEQGGISFIILSFTTRKEMYYIPFRDIQYFWNRMQNGGKKSFNIQEIDLPDPISQRYVCALSGAAAAGSRRAGPRGIGRRGWCRHPVTRTA